MTCIYYDAEFLEDGRTIELISIGLVTDDEREYYAVSSDAPWDRIRKHDWLVHNVVPHLPVTGRPSLNTYLEHHPNSHPLPRLDLVGPDMSSTLVKPRWVIANEVRDFILATPEPRQLWADYGAYDHVVLGQLWGPMPALPDGIPMWTHDLQQAAADAGVPAMPSMPDAAEHNALDDARECRYRHQWLISQAASDECPF